SHPISHGSLPFLTVCEGPQPLDNYAALHNIRRVGSDSGRNPEECDMEQNFNGPARLTGTIRQLRPSDLPRFREHLLRLDAESRRDRFNGFADDRFISAYAYRSFAAGTTVIGYVEGDKVLGAAEIHERAEESQ